jgi:hypothetical protein
VLEPHQGLRDLGLDSLMAVELRNMLQWRTGAVLPSTVAFDCPVVKSLADFVGDALGISADTPSQEVTAARNIAREVGELSDEDAEALLAQELNK